MEQLTASSNDESIKVFVRVRPPDPNLDSDLQRGACLDVTSESTLTVYSKPDPKTYTFDHVAGKNTTQEDVFSAVGRPIIDSCMCGYNGTIFAYGQTGSGKTFTMIGPPSEENADSFTHELRGIIPRSFEYLFSLINRNKQRYGELVEFLCKCSFLEIYNEQVFDLLDSASSGLHLRENMKHGVYVDGLTETSVLSAKEAYQVLSTGWVNRKVASTSMNRESSRSHAVFTLSVESKKRDAKDAVAKIRASLLNLVDLAGSERQRDTQAVGLRLKEAGSINRSLSALGNVIMALVDIANGKSRHVHYRDSKLTFLLRDSLGGNARTNLVANVHPSARCFGESLSTLNFARRAKMIRNKAVVNEDTSGNILQLHTEIKRLKGILERFRNQSNSATPSCNMLNPPSPPLSEANPDDEKAIRELRGMLTASMEARDNAQAEKTDLLDRVERLQQLCNKKDKFFQSTKMILKFRESHISNLEKARKRVGSPTISPTSPTNPPSSLYSSTISLLKQEIEQLKYLAEHHPDGSRLARENVDLKAELKKVRGAVGKEESARQLERSHQYTLQLEKQLRYYLAKGGMNGSSPISAYLAQTTPTKLALDLESLQLRCKHLQEELDKTRRGWSLDREEFHLRESKMEAGLAAARKANAELERSLEAMKLKNSVEKATLNDIHMTTIKTILTPRRERDQMMRNRSMSYTPSSHIHRSDSEPAKHQLSFVKATSADSAYPTPIVAQFPSILESPPISTPLSAKPHPVSQGDDAQHLSLGANTSTPHAKKPRLSKARALYDPNSNDEDKENSLAELEEGVEELDELNIQGALTDELKILQDRNRSLQQQLEGAERRAGHLARSKGELEAQVQEISQLSRLESESHYEKEQGFFEKITDMTSQIADIKSTNGVLASEVHDLRVCLKSADKELKELKDERKEERRAYEAKQMARLQQITELEQLCSSAETKYNRAMEELQNLQDEVETLREELTFKDHRLLDMEAVVRREKEAVSTHEAEVQSLLDKLTMEVEKSTRLSLELQEGQNGSEELVAMVNDNTSLRSEVDQLELELQSCLQSHKQQMQSAESSINTLLKQKATDDSAIAGLVASVQELRQERVQSDSRMGSLAQDLEESGKELSAAETKNEELVSEVEGLRGRLSKLSTEQVRELAKREAEREIIFEDLEALNDQYQQLNMAFEMQSGKLTEAKVDLVRVRGELESSEEELNRLLQEKMERRTSLVAKRRSPDVEWGNSVLDTNAEEEIGQLKRKLDQAASMIESYEESREEKNMELQQMKDQLLLMEKLQQDSESQQATITELQCLLSIGAELNAALEVQLQEVRVQVEQLQKERVSLVDESKRMGAENSDLRAKYKGQEELLSALTEQVERYMNSEEFLFQEKETIRSQLEMLHEEKAKLSKECEKLARENAAITGHHNIRQRIQYHATVKVENAKLKEEVIQLHSRLKRKAEQVDKLQYILLENGLDSAKHATARKRAQTSETVKSQLKENVLP